MVWQRRSIATRILVLVGRAPWKQRRRQLCFGTLLPGHGCLVDISKNAFNESAANVLAKIVHESTTVSLDFSHNRIWGELNALYAPAMLLQSLSASNNNLNRAMLSQWEALKRADLSHNEITSLGTLPDFIQYLDLRSNQALQLDSPESYKATDKLAVHEAPDGNVHQQLVCLAMKLSAEGSEE